MRARAATSLLIGVLIASSRPWGSQFAIAQDSPPTVIWVGEGVTWKKALSSPRPPYPKSAEKDRVEGVSVCQLEIDENGVVSDVEVLEIPHESVRASLTNTLQKWRFSTTRYHGEPVRLTGKLTFYFLRPSGRGCVLSANEYLEAKRKGAPSLTKMCEPGG